MKKLCKSTTDSMVFGVAGGLGEYFGIDSTLIRFIFALTTIFGGAGLWIYLILALIMPQPEKRPYNKSKRYSPGGRPMHEARPADEDKKDDNWSDF